jgi:TonB family protein
MHGLSIARSVAILLCAGGFAHASEKSTPSQDSQPFLKSCTVKNPQPCFDKPPVPTHVPDPECTKEARKKKIDTTVGLTVFIGIDGLVKDISVSSPVGYYGLDEAATKAVKMWRFKPGTSLGKPAPVQVRVEVEFTCQLS